MFSGRARGGPGQFSPVVVLLLGLFLPFSGALSKEQLTAEEKRFLEQYWRTPVAPQGKVPPGYSELEGSLHPEACGKCHPEQYRDWQSSLHSRAMGPGVLGQTVVMEEEDPATARLCWSCHAPLSEQQPLLLQDSGGGEAAWGRNPAFDPRLQKGGMICAACHVREHRRFGPPRRGGAENAPRSGRGNLPHGGFIAETAFGKSAFCKGCHQFGRDGYALNGKLLENTYQEWLQSGYPERGIHCQDCHMPDRRHLWRGIHDPEMTRKGVTIEVDSPSAPIPEGKPVMLRVTVSNTGTGHHFPTYLTPRVVVTGEQLDAAGNVLDGSEQQGVIGWEVTLDLKQESFDTRIPAGARFIFRYTRLRQDEAVGVRIRLRVEPDYFYERFFRAMLEGNRAGKGEALIRRAWRNALSTPYLLFERVIPLD